MEHEGLTKCFEFLSNEDVEINIIITDRHSQVKKYMKERKPEIEHILDVCHVAKVLFVNVIYGINVSDHEA